MEEDKVINESEIKSKRKVAREETRKKKKKIKKIFLTILIIFLLVFAQRPHTRLCLKPCDIIFAFPSHRF